MKTLHLIVPVEVRDDVTREQAVEALTSIIEVGTQVFDSGEEETDEETVLIQRANWGKPE